LLTNEPFFKKRSNQKFANRRNQIRYNNIKAYEKRKAKAPTERILDKNRTILKKVLGDAKTVIRSRDYLLGAEYNFNMFSYYRELNGKTYFGVYEFGIRKLDGDKYEIIKF